VSGGAAVGRVDGEPDVYELALAAGRSFRLTF
jgi:hypothetical protein